MHDGDRLLALLGGRRGAVEGALPSVVFVAAYAVGGRSLPLALSLALATGAVIAAVRAWRREPLRVVLGGLAAVTVAATVAARTGRAADYFLPSLLANVGSALVWAASIAVGWPLLGVVLGFLTGQRTSWRRDPDLVRAYSRASWIWAASFLLRAGLLLPFYVTGELLALGALKVALGWPLVVTVIWASWLTIRATLPEGHPGLFARASDPS